MNGEETSPSNIHCVLLCNIGLFIVGTKYIYSESERLPLLQRTILGCKEGEVFPDIPKFWVTTLQQRLNNISLKFWNKLIKRRRQSSQNTFHLFENPTDTEYKLKISYHWKVPIELFSVDAEFFVLFLTWKTFSPQCFSRNLSKNSIFNCFQQADADGLKFPVDLREVFESWTLQMGYPYVYVDRVDQTTFLIAQKYFLIDPDDKPNYEDSEGSKKYK